MDLEIVKIDHDLCIYREGNMIQTMNKLMEINSIAYSYGRDIEIDLSKTNKVTAAASLLLFAIVNRAQLCARPNQIIKISLPTRKQNPEGYTWIVSTGLAKALLANDFDKLDELTKSERYYQSSVNPYLHHAYTAQLLNKKADFTPEQFLMLESGISEAMLNVWHHAYDSQKFADLVACLGGKRWWQCAWFNQEKDRVTFIICDLGMGIPVSFSNPSMTKENYMDAAILASAWSPGQTRTGVAGRGNGSEDIKRPIGAGCTENESLLVHSGHARYCKSSGEEAPSSIYTKVGVPGTLVQWSLVPKRGEYDSH